MKMKKKKERKFCCRRWQRCYWWRERLHCMLCKWL